MTSARPHHLPGLNLTAAEKTLNTAIQTWNDSFRSKSAEQAVRPFLTVSRQPGAGAILFSHRLAAHLNQNGDRDWSAWDRELVEKVSSEMGISKSIIEMIPDRTHNWLDDLVQNFATSDNAPNAVETRAYKRVAMTIRALAAAGHAILVGQGARFVTAGMPGGIHLWMVAPLEHRIESMAQREGMSRRDAAAKIAQLTRNRKTFYERYWPGKVIEPETFTITVNVAELTVDELIEGVVPMIRARENQRPASGAAKLGARESTTIP